MSGLKSHDSHVLMQQFLLIALRGSNLLSNVVRPLVEMFTFFKGICLTTLTSKDLNRLESDIIVTLCKMEQVFPLVFLPAWFMLLCILFVNAVSVDPVQYKWMYLGEVNFYINVVKFSLDLFKNYD
jgi:hypothetical protein